ncbi:hypothetical protein CEXT_407771 [Caerostris extrusa]|uniref:Uncharacterized protein n=1 Tax=Caerostris extrusa TaxID=172846 RepID=A0AAV4MTN6_CAEEX|nr:hypothetical protein CEXT_407771 [Caerostris extrusa]
MFIHEKNEKGFEVISVVPSSSSHTICPTRFPQSLSETALVWFFPVSFDEPNNYVSHSPDDALRPGSDGPQVLVPLLDAELGLNDLLHEEAVALPFKQN